MPNDLSIRIKAIRLAKHLTQGQLAIKAGVTREFIKSVENGLSKKPRADRLERLANGLGIGILELREAAGYISANTEKAKRIETHEEILEHLKLAQPVSIPVYRKFHFGNPNEEPFDYVFYARAKAVGKNIEAFLVTGDCLSPRIENGDIVIVDRDKVPEPGKLMICLIGDEVAVGKYTMEKGTAYLTNHDAKVKITNVKACAVIINVIKDV